MGSRLGCERMASRQRRVARREADSTNSRFESAVSGALANPVHVRSSREQRTYNARDNKVRFESILDLRLVVSPVVV
jgi:hypothetical protein